MSLARDASLSPRQRGHKLAFKALLEKVGGLEASAEHCRLGKSHLSDCCNFNVLAFAPSDVIADLEAIAGDPVVTRYLATAANHALLALPDPAATDAIFNAMVGRLAKEGGELMSGVCQDLADDGVVSPTEARKRLVDADELVRVAVDLRAALRERAEVQD